MVTGEAADGSPVRGSRWHVTLEARLAAALVLLLSMAVGLGGVAIAVRQDRQATEAELQTLATSLARSVDLKLMTYKAALQTVAQTKSLRVDFNLVAVADHARRVGELFGGWFTVATGGDTLQVLMTTAPSGLSLPPPEPRTAFPEIVRAETESLRTGLSVVSDAFPGRVVGELVVAVASPLERPETPAPFVYFSVTLSDITAWLGEASLADEDFAAIADGSRRVIARSRDNEDFLLAELPEWYVAFSEGRDSGIALGAPVDGGLPRLFAMQRLAAAPGWTLVISRPVKSVLSSTSQSALPAVGALVTLLVSGGIAGLILDRRHARREALRASSTAAQREQLLGEIRAADTRKARLLAVLAHDLRTPLVALLGSLDLLRNGFDPAVRDHLLERIERDGHGMLQLIDDVLELARLGAGEVRLRPEPFAPAALLDDIAELVRPQAARKGTLIEVEAPDMPPLMGDVAALRRILLNFVTNAVKATEGGRIGLTVEVGPEGPDGRVVNFAISDTGRGIVERDIPLLFRDFGMLDRENAAAGGTGLGLAICRRLAKAMGGEVGVVSTLGMGSTFRLTVTLPTARTPPPRPDPRQTAADDPAAALVGLRVLVAEDQETIRRLTCMTFARHGAHAVEAADGIEAVERAAAECFDLILMDLRMPRLDGASAAARIRKGDGPSAKALIIGVTAHQTAPAVAQLSDFAMDACLPKPLDLSSLVAVLHGDETEPEAPPSRDGLLNPATLAELERIDGGKLLVRSMASLADRLTTAEREIAARIAARDAKGAGDVAHALAGLCVVLGAGRLAASLRAFEALSETADLSMLDEALVDMVPVIEATQAAIMRKDWHTTLPEGSISNKATEVGGPEAPHRP